MKGKKERKGMKMRAYKNIVTGEEVYLEPVPTRCSSGACAVLGPPAKTPAKPPETPAKTPAKGDKK
jgi:hypothetical protein